MTDETAVHLGSLDRRFAPYAFYFVSAARRAGIPLLVISGRRSSSENVEVSGAPRSLHLQGLAIDVQVLGYHRSDIPFAWWEHLGVFWEALGGRWGGRFVDEDINHFDVGLPPGQRV
jgi:hypothetical protein